MILRPLTNFALLAIFALGCSGETSTTQNQPKQTQLTEVKAKMPDAGVVERKLPTGHSTAEGVACDLARAFIDRNSELFLSTCIEKFSGGESGTQYESFLENTSSLIVNESKSESTLRGPARIKTVYAARHLSLNGPASYGYASFDFKDVMFVDVDVEMHSGNVAANRTLVIQKSDGKWYVHPAPNIHSLLSVGLNDETKSTIEFHDADSE